MSDPADIRTWAAEHGKPVGARGRIPEELRAEYEAEQAAADPGYVPVPDLPDQPTGETPPTVGPAGGIERKRWWQRQQAREPRREQDGRRVSLERWGSRGWNILAKLAGAPVTPASRVMMMQSPVAGMIIDDAVKGTALDRLVQPLAKMTEGAADIWALAAPPLIVAAMDRRPDLEPVLLPVLREALESYLVIAGPLMAKARRRQAKVLESLKLFEGPDGTPVTVDDLIADIFAPRVAATVEEPAAA